MGSFSLVLPAHNEAENIEPVVRHALEVLPAFFDVFEIIVVNDGSKDRTGEIIDRLSQEDPRVRPIHHKKNRGYGGALTSGFEASIGDHVMFMDSDRQFDIVDIERLYPYIPTHEIVAGFRMMRQDELHRRVFAEIFNLVVRVLFGVHLRDIDCAFKIFDGELIRSLQLSSPGALINTEIQAKARRQGARLQQVGVRHFPRIAGEATGGNPACHCPRDERDDRPLVEDAHAISHRQVVRMSTDRIALGMHSSLLAVCPARRGFWDSFAGSRVPARSTLPRMKSCRG